MNNSSNKKNILLSVIVIILLVAGGIYRSTHKTDYSAQFQKVAYEDNIGKFSINLLSNWSKLDQAVSTSSSDTWFSNPKASKEEMSGATILVRRFERTKAMSDLINKIGNDIFLDSLVENIKLDINKYEIISTSTIEINGRLFRETTSTYEGMGSGKKVTQHLYLNLTDDAYYMIGTDIYTDLLPKLETPILNSIKTFKIIK